MDAESQQALYKRWQYLILKSMSYNASELINAATIQARLNDAFSNVPSGDELNDVPFLRYLNMPENKGMVSNTVVNDAGSNRQPGGTRRLEVIYNQDLGTDEVDSNVSNPDCTSGSTRGENNYFYEIDTSINRQAKFSVNRTFLETTFTTGDEYVTREILKSVYAIERSLAVKEAAAAVALIGDWSTEAQDFAGRVDGVNYTAQTMQIKTEKDSSIDPYPYTARNLSMLFEAGGYKMAPIIWSGFDLVAYEKDSRTFAVADYGIDLAKAREIYGFGVMYDKYIKAAFGSHDYALAIQPGALQLITYLASIWKQGVIEQQVSFGADYVQRVIQSPRTGIPMDLLVTDSCGTVTFTITATTKLVGLPDDMYNAGNGFDGVNWVNKLQVVNS